MAPQPQAVAGPDLAEFAPDGTLDHDDLFAGEDNGDGPPEWQTDPTSISQRPPWELGDES